MRPYKKETLDYIYLKYMKNKHTNLPNEIQTEPNIDRQNNLIIGIAVGVTIMICAGLLVIMVVNS